MEPERPLRVSTPSVEKCLAATSLRVHVRDRTFMTAYPY